MTLARLLSEARAAESLPATGDVLAVGLPLLRQLNALHTEGLVARLRGGQSISYDGTTISLTDPVGRAPTFQQRAIDRVNPQTRASGVMVSAYTNIDYNDGRTATVHTSLDVATDPNTPPDRPIFVPGYQAWEQLHQHHDPLSDIHVAGLILVSYAAGLDLSDAESLDELATTHRHLLALNPLLHPVVAGVLSEMIRPDRHRRPTGLWSVITRLEHHRDLPTDLDLSEAYRPGSDWRQSVLSALRDRVFDTSRRNRALYFRPSASTVSLTEASVPLLLNVDRIRAKDLLTWTGRTAELIGSGKTVDLEKWTRFEEAPHVVAALDKLISAERKFRAENGAGRLRLVIAFLHWTDPETNDTVSTPLLTMSVDLKRRKGVKTRYTITTSSEPEVNPVLRYVFRQRFGITLPETVDDDVASIASLVATLGHDVQTTDPSVSIELIDKPRVNLIRQRAQLRLDTYRRRRARAQAVSGRWRRQSHSYDPNDWRPLGLALFDQFVRPAELQLRHIAGADRRSGGRQPTGPPNLAAPISAASSERSNEGFHMAGSDTNRQRWEVDLCAVTLAMLGSRRSSLARDYDDLLTRLDDRQSLGQAGDHKPFESLFTPEARQPASLDDEPISLDQRLVLPADNAQAQAVRRARLGQSFIIQGPPGTGKSQTIANVIAAMTAEGKRVLFVCEKRAALDVVHKRLNQVGLGDLVATIHDSQLDRRSFALDLGATYSSWLDQSSIGEAEAAQAEALDTARRAVRPLELLSSELERGPEGEPSTRVLLNRAVGLRTKGADPSTSTAPEVGVSAWLSARPGVDAVVAALADADLDPDLRSHALFTLRPSALGPGDAINRAREVGRALSASAEALTNAVGADSPPTGFTLDQMTSAANVAPVVLAVVRAGAAGALASSQPRHLDLRQQAQAFEQLQTEADRTAPGAEGWVELLAASDARTGLDIARRSESSVFRFLNRRWRKLKALVEAGYRFDQHQVRPSVSEVLAKLVDHYDARDAVDAARTASGTTYGVDDPTELRAVVDTHHANPVFNVMADQTDVEATTQIAEALRNLAATAAVLLVAPTLTLDDLAAVGRELARCPIAHERAALAWMRMAETDEAVLTAAAGSPSLDDTEAALIDRALSERAVDGLPVQTGAELDDHVTRTLAAHGELLGANAATIVETTRQRFLDNVAHSEASMAGRSNDDKQQKRVYNAGRRIVEREASKKMRFRSIRELATGESGAVVRDLRPIWLMSPLSVSDTLPLDTGLFDVVIFDEASQIPVEDAIPSIFRAPQVIVVGDRMQLPPTRFFSSAGDDDEASEVLVDEDGFRLSIALDADSFLTQADQGLPSAMLSWHYRSRSESLIAYSNNAFYGGDLATVPDQRFDPPARSELEADGPEAGATNAAATLDRPISFHSIGDGLYRDRRNQPEADYIAELVRAILAGDSGLTIGIVAFSEAQQGAIEDSLAELAAIDRDFATALDAEEDRTDEDELVGLFVKNLENVQGDERDIIIMSVCYGPGEDGRMRMNFGPINQSGGERRLNVIFSRAKRHMAIVSSITGADITNTHNEGAAHLARFLDYAAAESRADTAASISILNEQRGSTVSPPSVGADTTARELAQELSQRGHKVDLAVGRSDFQLDLAVRGDDGYRLGILIDPETNSPATVRYVAEAGVLAAFNWPIARVLVSEWWSDPATVIARIEATLG